MAKRKIEWSRDAEKDLKDILDFFNERNGNKKYSSKLIKQIKKIISFLSANNFLGKATDEEFVRIIFYQS